MRTRQMKLTGADEKLEDDAGAGGVVTDVEHDGLGAAMAAMARKPALRLDAANKGKPPSERTKV